METKTLNIIKTQTEKDFYHAVYNLQLDYFKIVDASKSYAILENGKDYIFITYRVIDHSNYQFWANTIGCEYFNYNYKELPFTYEEVAETLLNLINVFRDYELKNLVSDINVRQATFRKEVEE